MASKTKPYSLSRIRKVKTQSGINLKQKEEKQRKEKEKGTDLFFLLDQRGLGKSRCLVPRGVNGLEHCGDLAPTLLRNRARQG